MDKFTETANNILKPLKENTVVYSSEVDTSDESEEDAETSSTTSGISEPGLLNKKALDAIGIAQKLSTQAAKSGIYGFRTDPQKAMNQAYGKLMIKLADRIKKIDI